MEGYFSFMRSVTVVSVLHHYTRYTHYTYYSAPLLMNSRVGMFSFSRTFEPIVICIVAKLLDHTTAQTGGPGRLLPAT